MPVSQGAGDKKGYVLAEITELHVVKAGAVRPGNPDEECANRNDPDKNGYRCRPRKWPHTGPAAVRSGNRTPRGIYHAEKKQGYTEPQRAGP